MPRGWAKASEKRLTPDHEAVEAVMSQDVHDSKDVRGSPSPVFDEFTQLLEDGDASGLRNLLKEQPQLREVAQQALLREAQAQNLANVSCLLSAGVDPNVVDSREKISPLYVAARLGSDDMVELLLEAGADPDRGCDCPLASPSIAAATYGHDVIVENLHDAGANLKLADFNNNLPLHVAARNGHLETVKYLVKRCGVPLNVRGSGGATPLMMAVETNQPRVVSFCMNKGCDVSIGNGRGETPLWMACRHARVDMVKAIIHELLLAGGRRELDTADTQGQTPLYVAVKHRHLNVARVLTKAGVDVNIAKHKGLRPFQGETPLLRAISDGNQDFVSFLLEHKDIDINRPFSGQNVTPLHWAVLSDCANNTTWSVTMGPQRNFLQLASDILDHEGVDIDTLDQEYDTPLYTACSRGNIAMTVLLVSRGANINQPCCRSLKKVDKDSRSGQVLMTDDDRKSSDVVSNRDGDVLGNGATSFRDSEKEENGDNAYSSAESGFLDSVIQSNGGLTAGNEKISQIKTEHAQEGASNKDSHSSANSKKKRKRKKNKKNKNDLWKSAQTGTQNLHASISDSQNGGKAESSDKTCQHSEGATDNSVQRFVQHCDNSTQNRDKSVENIDSPENNHNSAKTEARPLKSSSGGSKSKCSTKKDESVTTDIDSRHSAVNPSDNSEKVGSDESKPDDVEEHFLRPIDGAILGGHSNVVKYLIGKGAAFDIEEWKCVLEIWKRLESNQDLLKWITEYTLPGENARPRMILNKLFRL